MQKGYPREFLLSYRFAESAQHAKTSAAIAKCARNVLSEFERAIQLTTKYPDLVDAHTHANLHGILMQCPQYIVLRQKLDILSERGGALEVQDMALFSGIASYMQGLVGDNAALKKSSIFNAVTHAFNEMCVALAEKGMFLGKDIEYVLSPPPSAGNPGYADGFRARRGSGGHAPNV